MPIRLNPNQSDPESDLETQLLAMGAIIAGNLLSVALLQNKLKTIKYKDKYDARAKLFRFGASRGFEPNILTKVIEKIEI